MGIPIIAYVIVNQVGGIDQIFHQIPAEKLRIVSHQKFSYYMFLAVSWTIFPIFMVDPAIVQRMLMAKHPRQLRDQYLVSAVMKTIFRILFILIGLGGFILYSDVGANNVVLHAIRELLPVGIKGFAMAGFFALIMSTTDSYLHVAGVTLVHDVVKPLLDIKNITINEKKWAQGFTLLLGLISIGIGLSTTNLFGLLLDALESTAPFLMFPLVSGIMGLKTDKRSFFGALGITFVVFCIAKLLLPSMYMRWTLPISVIANVISFLSIHFVTHKGFAIINREKGKEKLWKPRKRMVTIQLKRLLPLHKNIVQYSQQKVRKYGAPYVLFGIFCCVNFTIPYFMWVNTHTPETYHLMLILRIIGAVLCALLIVKDQWPHVLKPYIPIYWHACVLYEIPFISTIMFLSTQCSTE